MKIAKPWLALLLLALAACAAPERIDYAELNASVAPPAGAADTPTPRLGKTEIIMADGVRLPLHAWLPEGKPKAVILALHGFNDYSNAFAIPGASLAWQGIATYAYDQRGFGEAPLRGRWPGRWQLADDLATASRLLRAAYPGVPLYLLGESMGGAVVATAMTEPAALRPNADGIILVAPAVWGREAMGIFERSALWAGIHLLPSTRVSGKGLVKLRPSDNMAMLRAFVADPLVIKETRVDAVYGLVDLMQAALAAAPHLETPLLYLYGARDEIVPEAATRLMLSRLPQAASARQQIAWYPNGYHMLLRDLGGAVATQDIASWIASHGAPLPSGAERYAALQLEPRPATVSAAVEKKGPETASAEKAERDKPFANAAPLR